MTAINLVAFVGAFAIQWLFGELVDILETRMSVAAAYRISYGVLILAQAGAFAVLLGARDSAKEN